MEKDKMSKLIKSNYDKSIINLDYLSAIKIKKNVDNVGPRAEYQIRAYIGNTDNYVILGATELPEEAEDFIDNFKKTLERYYGER